MKHCAQCLYNLRKEIGAGFTVMVKEYNDKKVDQEKQLEKVGQGDQGSCFWAVLAGTQHHQVNLIHDSFGITLDSFCSLIQLIGGS